MAQEGQYESPILRPRAGHLEVALIHREGLQKIPEHAWMGLCPVHLRHTIADVQTISNGTRVWVCLPHTCGVAGLHLYGVSGAIKLELLLLSRNSHLQISLSRWWK